MKFAEGCGTMSFRTTPNCLTFQRNDLVEPPKCEVPEMYGIFHFHFQPTSISSLHCAEFKLEDGELSRSSEVPLQDESLFRKKSSKLESPKGFFAQGRTKIFIFCFTTVFALLFFIVLLQDLKLYFLTTTQGCLSTCTTQRMATALQRSSRFV